jgi:phosphatidylglycerol---prolipoprotein diacylglyceryl transferase
VTFPVIFHPFGFSIEAHRVFELAGYVAASILFFVLRKRFAGPKLGDPRGQWIIVGCVAGAAIGSKGLAIIESIHAYWPVYNHPELLISGKTIAGGLAGGWAGVEIAKHFVRVRQSTGDRFVFPFLLGLAIGRIGCFLEGLPDHTYGIATSLPWGVDFGDGIHRHPTQLYESVFCIVLGLALFVYSRRPHPAGRMFQIFAFSYFAWRFAVEFIKPRETYFGLSPIQICSFIAACFALRNLLRPPAEPMPAVAAAAIAPAPATA